MLDISIPTKSVEELQKEIKTHGKQLIKKPKNHLAYFYRAKCYMALEKHKLALEDIQKTIEIVTTPGNSVSDYQLGVYHALKGVINDCLFNFRESFGAFSIATSLIANSLRGNPQSDTSSMTSLLMEYFYLLHYSAYNIGLFDEAIDSLENILTQAQKLECNNVEVLAMRIAEIKNDKEVFNKIKEDLPDDLKDKFTIYRLNTLNEVYHRITNNNLKQSIYKLVFSTDDLKKMQIYHQEDATISQYTKMDNIKFMFNTKIKKSDIDIDNNKKLNIRMYNAIHMNDPLEGSVFNQFIKSLNTIKENGEPVGDLLDKLYPSSGIVVDSNTYLVSFSSAKKESIPMWGNYGGDSIGARIEVPASFFDVEDFKYVDIKENSNLKIESCCLYSVVYLESDGDIYKLDNAGDNLKYCTENIYFALSEIAKYTSELKDEDEDKINTFDIIRDILDQVRFLFKSDVYAYEEEVRVIKLRFKGASREVFLSEVDDILKVPKLYIELEKDIPYEDISITLGAKVQKPKEVANYLRHIGVKSVKKSSMPYQ